MGGDATTLYFIDVLKTQLLKLNKGIVDDANCADVMRKLGLLKPTLEGNQEALAWIRGEKSTFVAIENRERNVTLIDFENPENNLFHVTDVWEQQGTVHRNRADVVFLINGIPIAFVEAKSVNKRDGLALGVEQIHRYHNETPEMFTTPQLFAVTQLTDLYYSVTWNTSRKNLFNWKTDEPTNYEQKIKTFFDRNRLLQTLQRSIIFQSRDDKLTKVVLRQHQTRTVEKVIERVNDPEKRRGLVWHTQGSGKILTMITIASRLLRGGTQTEKPTVLMLVDRNELESQLFKNITGYGITSLKVAQRKDDLEEILSSDYRGLVVSMIHKFDKRPTNINTRENVVVLVDEALRTTGGDRADAAIEAFEDQQTTTQDILAEFRKLAEEYASAARERSELGLDNNAFAIYRELKNYITDITHEQAQSVNQIFEQFPDSQWDQHQQQKLRLTLYKTLSPSVDIHTKIEITNRLLDLQRL